jgi:hypothetical protein
MIICYTHGYVPYPGIIRDASSYGKRDQNQRPIARHERERDRERDRQRDRQTDIDTDRQTDRQTDTHTHTHTHTHTEPLNGRSQSNLSPQSLGNPMGEETERV